MAWVLLDDNFATHPKVMAAVHLHPLARDLFVCALCYCRKFQTDGTVPRSAMKAIGFVGNERKAIDALLDVGLLDRSDGGFQIHDYAKFYPSDAGDKAQREERNRLKREAGRKGGLASWAKRSAEAFALSLAEAESKQLASTVAEAHRVGSGNGSEVLGSSSEGSLRGTAPNMAVEWLLFFNAFPSEGRIDSRLAQGLFLDARHSGVTLAAMVEALDNHKASARWAAGKIPNLTTWLEDKRWQQRLPPPKPAAGGRTGAAPAGKYDGIEEAD